MTMMDKPSASALAPERQAKWIDVCALDAIPLRGSRVVRAPLGWL